MSTGKDVRGKSERLEKKRLERKEQKKKKVSAAILIAAGALLLTAALAVGGWFAASAIRTAYEDSGARQRKEIVLKSEHYKVDGMMLTFCFYETLEKDNVYENLGVKNAEELKTICYKDENGVENKDFTRYRYYAEYAASQLENDLYFAEAARAKGLTLDGRDKARIDAKLAAIENAAALQGRKTKDYIFATYGRGVKLSDIRNVYELRALADKNMEAVYTALTVGGDELNAAVAEAGDLKYYRADYMLYGFLYTADDPATPARRAADEEKVRALAACKSAEEFLALCRTYIAEEHKDDAEFTDDDLEAELSSCVVTGRAFENAAEGSLDRWIFDFDRKPGETAASYGESSQGAVYMLKPAYSADVPQKGVRILKIAYENYARVSDAAAAFKKVTALWDESDRGAGTFTELVRAYSEDWLTAYADGLEKDTYSSTSFNGMISSWLAEAKAGDSATFSDSEGMYLVYFAGDTEVRSVTDAEKAVKRQKYRAITGEYPDLFPVTAGTDDFTKIAPLKG